MENYIVAYPSPANFGDHQVTGEVEGISHNSIDTSMLSYEEEDPSTIPLTEMFLMGERYDKDYYRDKYPYFDEKTLNILEWSSAGQLDEMVLRYKVKRREEKLRKRREMKLKMKKIGRSLNNKKMKKIMKKITMEF